MSKLKCRGIGVVIDDKVPLSDEEVVDDSIGEIVRQLKADGISLLRYKEIPSEEEWNNFGGVAFMLIDWSLLPSIAGVVAKSKMRKRICDFIRALNAKAFAPIFIFSNQDENEIKQSLKANKIEVDVPNAYVLVRPKAEMRELDSEGIPKLFGEINSWIHATPAINLFTSWGKGVLEARNQMFAEFYGKSQNWPNLLWKAYKDDCDDPAYGLAQVMFDNLKARITCRFDSVPNVNVAGDDLSALIDVLSLTVMMPASVLPGDQVGCGDLFKIENGKFWLVVSCDCDCIVHEGENREGKSIQVVRVDGGCEPQSDKMKERFSAEFGFLHKQNQSYLFPLLGKCYCVSYKKLALISLSGLDIRKRIGRIIPPYITDIRQRLAQWNQRMGFPKLPSELFPSVQEAVS